MWRQEERSMGTSIRATFDWDEGETVYVLVGQKGTSVCDEVILIESLKSLFKYSKIQRKNTQGSRKMHLVSISQKVWVLMFNVHTHFKNSTLNRNYFVCIFMHKSSIPAHILMFFFLSTTLSRVFATYSILTVIATF